MRLDRHSVSFLAAALVVGLGAIPAQAAIGLNVTSAPFKPDSGSVAVHCGHLIDGVSAQPRGPVTVLILSGKVTEVAEKVTVPAGTAELDLSGYTCLPGLRSTCTRISQENAREHSCWLYRGAPPTGRAIQRTSASITRALVPRPRAISQENARETLLAGFTGARNVGTYNAWRDRDLRDAINAGSAIGPEQFRQKAEAAVAGGADLLKIIASGAVLAYGGVPGEREMTPEEIKAVVDVAHAHGIKVAAHAHGAQSIKDAILAGADTIEHASLIDDEDIRLAKEHGTGLSMDVYNGDWIDTVGRQEKWPEEFLRKNIETTEAQRQGFTKAHAAGLRSSTARTRRCIRTASMPGSSRSWSSAA